MSVMNQNNAIESDSLISVMASEKIDVTLSPADVTDLPALAEINRDAYSRETVAMIAFKNWPDETNMFNFFKFRIKERMETPNTLVLKATVGTAEIAGFVCFTRENGKGDGKPGLEAPVPNPTEKALQEFRQIPDFFNMEFILGTQNEVGHMSRLINGMKHYCEWVFQTGRYRLFLTKLDLSNFVVAPKYQGRGIGSKLLHQCLEIADKDGLPTWLGAFPGSHNLYLRFGFEDVEHQDIDLNKWDHYRFRGFGIYRNYSMVRQPKSPNSIT
jgi:GNAT superfamily N-acetyltransferase